MEYIIGNIIGVLAFGYIVYLIYRASPSLQDRVKKIREFFE